MKGYTKERVELAETAIPLTAQIPVVPCRGGESFLRKLFEPLGYQIECRQLPLDNRFPNGERVRISGSKGVGSRYCHINADYVNFGGGPAARGSRPIHGKQESLIAETLDFSARIGAQVVVESAQSSGMIPAY
jgi:hypothetical protein